MPPTTPGPAGPDPLNHDAIDQAINNLMASITPLDKARASHPAGRSLKAAPAPADAPPAAVQALIAVIGVVLQNVIAARALAALTTRLHEHGVPVPALTYRQASRLWMPAAIIVGAVAFRAHGAIVASRRQAAQVEELRQRRRKIAADRLATTRKVSA
jgi:hypothetical protein